MKLIRLSTSALPLVASVAFAADLPTLKAPPPPPPPLWAGLYGGLNLGGASVDSGAIDYSTGPSPTGRYLIDTALWRARSPFWTTQRGSLPGNDDAALIGGAQLGYNFQLGYAGEFIAGLEADLQGLVSGRGNHNLVAAYRNILVNRDGLLNGVDGGAALDFLGTVRARVGYLMNPTLLVYATGGLAFGGVGYSLSNTSLYTNAAGVRAQNAIGNLDALTTQPGWTAGVGLEWMFMPRWSLKAEYLYYDLGRGNARTTAAAYPVGAASAFGGSVGAPADWTTTSVRSPHVSGSIARIGLNYHFAADPAPTGRADAGGSDGMLEADAQSEGHAAASSDGMQGKGEKGAGHAGHDAGGGAGGRHGAKSKGAGQMADSFHQKDGGSGDGHDGEKHGKKHTVVPAGVYGAHMVGPGEARFAYTPSYAVMRGNYIGESQIAPYQVTTIPWAPNSPFAMPTFYAANRTRSLRNAPDNMKMQMHMFHAMFGVTDWFNVMVMGSLSDRNMSMTVFKGPSGPTPLAPTNSATQGWGDTAVQGLFRLYQDDIHHLHANLGLSIPTGSIVEEIIHMHPSAQFFSKRAYYGLQLGTGTFDGLFGFTYTGKLDVWSWGLIYRGRAALGDNNAGYLRGLSNEFSAWGGYELLPGLAATGRVAATVWDRIYGHDEQIWGAQQGTVPGYQGGERVKLLGGLEYLIKFQGFKPIRLAVEAGAPIYQRLNGPQLGQSWELNTALNFGF
jgi:opacity protein-like surface antigen